MKGYSELGFQTIFLEAFVENTIINLTFVSIVQQLWLLLNGGNLFCVSLDSAKKIDIHK